MEMRTTKPGKGNKYYIRKAQGGYSNAIYGKPTDSECNVLANCVGYAYGRFNEIGGYGYCKYLAPVNAENFMDYKGSCKTGMTPKVGACMVWEGKGNLAGHVAIVEKVYDNNHVYTSESGYGSSAFWNQHRYNNNGRWGCGSNYSFKGFIYNPAVKDEPAPAPTPSKSVDELAQEVIAGLWGNQPERQQRLEAAGYDYYAVQARVNEILAPAPAPKPSKSVDDLAREVIRGDWGNGQERKDRLTAAGYDYSTVQARVNEMLSGNKPAPKPVDNTVTYTVKPGDTLWGIAERFLGKGSRWREIYYANQAIIGANPNIIHPGQKLTIKK
jgi:LysM repeat protein